MTNVVDSYSVSYMSHTSLTFCYSPTMLCYYPHFTDEGDRVSSLPKSRTVSIMCLFVCLFSLSLTMLGYLKKSCWLG